ncbi:F-box only protein 21-like [Bacillus rossius redtenbacheri]|uniref:F-box only protein 21-like n=1 Tax=Bacillus rossius redtenbacheri TaxID=93214 RepID=UPI002FDD07EA
MEEVNNVTIECLPVEIVENILQNDSLTFKDVVNFSSTCRRFREIVNGSNKVWKKTFFQKWPLLQKAFDHQKVCTWRREFAIRLHIGFFVLKKLAEFSPKFIDVDEISDSEFEDFRLKLEEHHLNYCYMVDELKTLFDSDMNCNLTNKYYGTKLMRFLKQEHLKEVWNDFIHLSPEEQLLETGAAFVAQWCQPLLDISTADIAMFCDDIAEKVKLLVMSKNSSHSLLNVSPEQLNDWRGRNISDNHFSSSESKQILSVLCEVLFQHYNFSAGNEMFQFMETSLFNWVIEHRTGTALTMSILIESIARRLGVKCEVVVFPSHLLLRWKEKYKGPEYDSFSPSSYIDVFNGGQFLTKRSCPKFSSNGECPMKKKSVCAANAVEVVEHLATDVYTAVRREGSHSGKSSRVRSGLELLVVVKPTNPYNVLHAARFYTDYHLESRFLLSILDRLQMSVHAAEHHQLQLFSFALNQLNSQHSPRITEVTPKHNNGTVKYAVGMIMHHRHYGYRCVIYGWDYRCKATPEWILQMGVGNLEYKTGQPFYNVLVTDGTTRYAAQENLEMHSNPQWIEHPLVGRYFDTYCGTHYVPNEVKALEYPDDEKVRMQHVTSKTLLEMWY